MRKGHRRRALPNYFAFEAARSGRSGNFSLNVGTIRCQPANHHALLWSWVSGYVASVRLMLENLPISLAAQRATLARCLEAMDRVLPLRAVYLFGSHARGEARPDSDVDLCLVADGAEKQLEAAQQFRRAMRPIQGKPSFTLVPIAPARLAEKKIIGDFFFQTILDEGVLLAAQN